MKDRFILQEVDLSDGLMAKPLGPLSWDQVLIGLAYLAGRIAESTDWGATIIHSTDYEILVKWDLGNRRTKIFIQDVDGVVYNELNLPRESFTMS